MGWVQKPTCPIWKSERLNTCHHSRVNLARKPTFDLGHIWATIQGRLVTQIETGTLAGIFGSHYCAASVSEMNLPRARDVNLESFTDKTVQ